MIRRISPCGEPLLPVLAGNLTAWLSDIRDVISSTVISSVIRMGCSFLLIFQGSAKRRPLFSQGPC